MPIVKLDISRQPAFRAAVASAAKEIRTGRLVAFPTETVYGLGADATDGLALAQIFDRKGRPKINPLIVHVPDVKTARNHVVFNDRAESLAAAFWPGGLTMVLPRQASSPIHDLASAGLPTLAIRIPSHPVALALLLSANTPIAAPSANRSGEPSPTTAAHVSDSLGSADLTILDGGPTSVGLESTIVGFDGDECILLRPGAIPRDKIEAVVGRLSEAADDAHRPSSPGRLLRHYAPCARIRLNAAAPEEGELYLGFGPLPDKIEGLQLSVASSTHEAAANLFAMLREADKRGVAGLAIAPIPNDGLGEAINDRLQRAASAQA